MPDQLFLFASNNFSFIVAVIGGTKNPLQEAKTIFSQYLDQHPDLPKYEDFKAPTILGKVSDCVYSF